MITSKLRPAVLSLVALAQLAGCAAPQRPASPTLVEPHFSPQEQIAPTIIKLIDNASQTLDIAALSFTRSEIAAAVVRAHQRGVRVRVVMDTTSAGSRYSTASDLVGAGIPVRVRRKRGSQHSKYLIIDESVVATGSYNFTLRADERNSENLLVIRDSRKVVRAFLDDYEKLREDSVTYHATPGPTTESITTPEQRLD